VTLGEAPSDDEDARGAEAVRSHVVARGDSAWTIARRYGLTTRQLLERNRLDARSVLRPGMVLSVAADAAP
jgi:membrane-bound lytic murein transglycosylase D